LRGSNSDIPLNHFKTCHTKTLQIRVKNQTTFESVSRPS
jgi:hypothetical protein